MSGGEIPDIILAHPNDALSWWSRPRDLFFIPKTAQHVASLKAFLASLPDGSTLPVRGRDFIHSRKPGSPKFDSFDYGVCLKNGKYLWFLYESGDIEMFPIHGLNYWTLVHFVVERYLSASELDLRSQLHVEEDSRKTVIISHGYSPDVGCEYPLIRTLECVARGLGWKVVVPSFLESYRFGRHRGREMRVRMIYGELLCCSPKPHTIVLAGHSQGGAATSLVCQDSRVVASANIKGMILFGSESAYSLDGMRTKPAALKPHQIRIVHARGDGVISHPQIEDMVSQWELPEECFVSLQSNTPVAAKDIHGDDIRHDFLSKDLITGAVSEFAAFLKRFEFVIDG